MNRYFKYGNDGGIDRVIKREINSNSGYYNSLCELLHSINYSKNVTIMLYSYDPRIGKFVFMVRADHSGLKNQFVCYFIED